MGTLEFASSVLTVFFVVALAYQKAYAWPVGIAGTLLAIFPYFHAGLVAEAFLQGVYSVVGAIGWWRWIRNKDIAPHSPRRPTWLTGSQRVLYGGLFVGLWAMVGAGLASWSSMPWMDTGLFAAGVVGTWLESNRKTDAWGIWILANGLSVWTAWNRDLHAFAALYILLTALSFYGLFKWTSLIDSTKAEKS